MVFSVEDVIATYKKHNFRAITAELYRTNRFCAIGVMAYDKTACLPQTTGDALDLFPGLTWAFVCGFDGGCFQNCIDDPDYKFGVQVREACEKAGLFD